ncbi:hypothetical protein G5B38_13790 [Pseudohalocynthiibacter aestuariivivens]|uniref:Avidin family protein n=1 Tax=Roseovarius pelagicus TaxID=2980108 RepID=A0ABY6DFN7_9RHOB|nr:MULTISPECIES: hypothetical protein [Rhodobacterales]QIE46507.1 hypothetical protein G5B38_13790 [Pseudohalocynthiibacter aestuariivivens]UXX84971.1 hypothetical protein N7U68_10155 [Roseovarius pelagicus]
MKITMTLAALAVAVAAQAQAEAFDSDGVASGVSKSELIEFGPDHKVINSRISYNKFEMENKTHPMNQLSGPCFGTVEVRGGAVEGNGVCVLDGLEGDRVLLGWVARRMNPKGELIGYWTVNNGTGMWLQASGGGTFRSNVNQANGTATNTLKGAVTLR